MRVISFCAEGLREAAKRGFYEWLNRQDADFICIQDLRCSEYDLQDDVFFPSAYNAYFFDDVGGKDNGVAIYCRSLPKAIMTGLGFADYDMQGRYIQADFQDLSIGCLLAPTAKPDDNDALAHKHQFFELLGPHLQKVRNKRRDYVICGGWDIALEDEDVEDRGSAEGQPGFMDTERAWLGELLDRGYADAYRQVTSEEAFTFWPQIGDLDAESEAWVSGWRTDLQIVSEDLQDLVEHAAIYTAERFSRHAPLIIDYDLEF